MPANHDQFTNYATTLLAGGAGGAGTQLNPADTTMTVNDGSTFPATTNGAFNVVLTSGASNEIVKCTARSGNTFTIVRAQEGTTALTFAVGSTVTHDLTAANVTNLWTRVQEWPINARDYGAVADGVADYNCAVTSGSTALATTTSPGPFTSAMTGRNILVRGAAANGADLWTTVTFVDSQHLTLGVAASTTASGDAYVVNTNDLAAIQAAMSAVVAAGGGDLYLPAGVYLLNTAAGGSVQVTKGTVRVRGAGQGATVLVSSGAQCTGTVGMLVASAAADIIVEDMTLIGPAHPDVTLTFPTIGVWQQGTKGRVTARRVTAHGFTTSVRADNATSADTVQMLVEDCDFDQTPLAILGVATMEANDFVSVSVYGCSVHDFGVAASNQNHGVYFHQSCNTDIAHCRFDTNRGTGFAIHLHNGAGNSSNASIDDCWFGPNSYQGLTTNATVRTRISNCRFLSGFRAIYNEGDFDVFDCEFDNVSVGQVCIQQFAVTGTNAYIRDCWFNLPAVTGTSPISSNVAGNSWVIRNCAFTCNRAAAVSNSGGGAYLMDDCMFADDGIGHHVLVSSATPTLTGVTANVTAQTVAGDDAHGVVSFNVQTATIAAATQLFTVTFAKAYATAPVVVVANASNSTTGAFFVLSVATTGFVVCPTAALGVATGYKVNYIVIG